MSRIEEERGMYTVKQVAELAGVSVRTLHHYDQIGLLKPPQIGANGYRYYDDDALLRLQQILFYRELGLELAQINDVLNRPDFDVLTALKSHRIALIERGRRISDLIDTIDDTIKHLSGEAGMSRAKLFKGFSDEQQKQYEREARLQWDPQVVNSSIKRWNTYTPQERDAIADEGNAIYGAIADAIDAGLTAASDEAQMLIRRWHQHITYFYEPTLEMLRGLGDLYTSHPDFSANFAKVHPELAGFMQSAINQYVDDLEHAEIVRLLAGESGQGAGVRGQ
ncbi:MAG: MerR family transcriptional regulator [Chloroflexi bacterium]|jgi:DNA-binding transcriptional MerR regulator|nr:MerR family transcriptional regulator [Chloroflexota bacterium]